MASHGSSVERTDPYGVNPPATWTCRVEDGEAVYESPTGQRRVVVREFSRNLSLYWWVDLRARTSEGWVDRDVVGETFSDPEKARDAACDLVARIDTRGTAATTDRGAASSSEGVPSAGDES